MSDMFIYGVSVSELESSLSDQVHKKFGLREDQYEDETIRDYHWKIIEYMVSELRKLSREEFDDVFHFAGEIDDGFAISDDFVENCLKEM